jgi:arsenite-transporting ATPase
MPEEVTGKEKLLRYANYLWKSAGPHPSPERLHQSHPPSARRPGSERGWGLEDWSDIKFLFFGGKGGVGKTSLAAASSLHLAGRQPDRRILVLSIDPAHSLSDSLGCELGDQPRPIPGFANLDGLELDAAKSFAAFKERYKNLASGTFNHFLEMGVDPTFDRKIAEGLGALLPPGLEEIMAISEILDFETAGDYGLYVFDTAPTGHLLRFLRMPGLIQQWVERALKILLKSHKMAEGVKLALEMIELSKKVKKIQRLFSDPRQSECVVVTIPEALPVLETERLLQDLAELKFSCRHIAVNMVQVQNDCSFCSSRRRNQETYLKRIMAWNPDLAIALLPLWPRPVRGTGMLEEVSQVLFSE